MPPDEFANLDEWHRCAREKLEQHARLRLQKDTLDGPQRVGLYQAILACTRTSNLTIVDKILSLPREVRNLIYAALLCPGEEPTENPSWIFVHAWENFNGPWLSQTGDSYGYMPHFFHHRFMGRQYASEVFEQFRISIGRDETGWVGVGMHFEYTLMGAFMDKNLLGIGKSIEELVRNLDLLVVFDLNPTILPEDTRCSPTYVIPTGVASSSLETALTLLMDIPFTERIEEVKSEEEKSVRTRPRRIELSVYAKIRYHNNEENGEESAEKFVAFMADMGRLAAQLNPICRTCRLLHEKGFEFQIEYVDHHEERPTLTFDNNCLTWAQDDWFMEFEAYWEEHLSNGSGIRGQREVVTERIWDQFMLAFLKTKPSGENETSE